MEFQRTGANQNIDPEYVKMVSGINEDLLGKNDISDGWIKCSERLPERQGMYLVAFLTNGKIKVSYSFWEQKTRDKFGWRSRELVRRKYITHWMPFPDEPREY